MECFLESVTKPWGDQTPPPSSVGGLRLAPPPGSELRIALGNLKDRVPMCCSSPAGKRLTAPTPTGRSGVASTTRQAHTTTAGITSGTPVCRSRTVDPSPMSAHYRPRFVAPIREQRARSTAVARPSREDIGQYSLCLSSFWFIGPVAEESRTRFSRVKSVLRACLS